MPSEPQAAPQKQADVPAPPKKQPRTSWSVQRIALVLTALVGIAGTFLPWVYVGALSFNGTQGDGWFTVVFFALVIVASIAGQLHRPLGLIATVFALLGGAAALCTAIEKIDTFEKMTAQAQKDLVGNAFGRMLTQATSVGSGVYLIAIAGATTVLVALFFRR